MTNLRSLLTMAIKLIEEDWGGTSADSEGNIWLKEAREYLAQVPVEPIAADLERLICDLADIGESTDVDARKKARRLYNEMRLKYPIDVQEKRS